MTATEQELANTKTALEAAEQKASKADERIGNLEKAARSKRFSELSKDWIGDKAKHVGMLEHFATFDEKGEESEMFKDYVTTQNATAEQLKAAGLFTEIGSSAPAEGSITEMVNTKVKTMREADPKLTDEIAFENVWQTLSVAEKEQYREEDRRLTN